MRTKGETLQADITHRCYAGQAMTPVPAVEGTFWRFVMPEPNSGCWLWMGSVNPGGYAQLWVGTHQVRAHIYAYRTFRGPISEGLQLDHKCRVRCCVNPDHLEIVTPRENTLRGIGPTAKNAQKTHCVNGHEFTPENTAWRPTKNPERRCRACRRAQWYAAEARRRAALRQAQEDGNG